MKNNQLDERTQPKGRYQHYKGSEYQVIDTAYHSETQQLLVLYRPLYGKGELWVRPYDMFNELVESKGKKQPRFQLIATE